MVTDKEVIYVVCLVILTLSQMFGFIDIPSIAIRALDDAEYHFNEPKEMNLHVTGMNPHKDSTLGFIYRGYDVKTTVTNTGKSGYANITCSAYDLNGELIARRYIYPHPHFERDSSIEFCFNFDSAELPDEEYIFNITISDQVIDS